MAHSFEYVRHNLDGSIIFTYILVMLIVPLKLACRIPSGMNTLGWDDYLAVVSLVIANGFFYSTIIGKLSLSTQCFCQRSILMMDFIGARPVLGQPVTNFTVDELILFLNYVYAASIMYVTAIATIKASLIAFFWRLFSVRSRVPLIMIGAAVVAWAIAVVSP